MNTETLLLDRSTIQSLITLPECIEIVEDAFRRHAEGRVLKPDLIHVDSTAGEFHVKAGGVITDRAYFGLKSNGGFFQNQEKYGLPNIQGVILLCDGENGSPLAILESGLITILRTGAATAVAARYLARETADTVTICGCGTQGRIQLASVCQVRPVKKVFAVDQNPAVRDAFAREMAAKLQVDVVPTEDLQQTAATSQIVVTCTPAHRYFLTAEMVKPGTFVAAVGADSPEKQELEPALLAASKVVTDITDQCAAVGELHHAIAAGLMTREQVHAEIGEIVTGRKPARESEDEVIVYDATGTALQDVATALAVYQKAVARQKGLAFAFRQ